MLCASHPYCRLKTELQGCGLRTKAGGGASGISATRSMHDLGAQHHSQFVLARSRFCGRRQTGLPRKNLQSQIGHLYTITIYSPS